MPRTLLTQAQAVTEGTSGAVRVAALLLIARVLTAFNDDEALQQLDRALELLDQLPDEDRRVMGREAVCAAATVSPDRTWPLAHYDSFGRFVNDMLRYRHAGAAVSYLAAFSGPGPFPFRAVTESLRHAKDPETKQAVLRRTTEYWRRDSSPDASREFERIFQFTWARFPPNEAAAIVREFVARVEREPDQPTNANMGGPLGEVTFVSSHATRLFQMLGPLRHLTPSLADETLARHPELAAAAARYPKGFDSMRPPDSPAAPRMSEAERREWRRAHDLVTCGDEWVPVSEALETEFARPLARAARTYRTDTAPTYPNLAPKPLWPSAVDYRNILRKAGEYEGRAAERYVERVPDSDLRLLALIELTGALAGLPQFSYSAEFRPPAQR